MEFHIGGDVEATPAGPHRSSGPPARSRVAASASEIAARRWAASRRTARWSWWAKDPPAPQAAQDTDRPVSRIGAISRTCRGRRGVRTVLVSIPSSGSSPVRAQHGRILRRGEPGGRDPRDARILRRIKALDDDSQREVEDHRVQEGTADAPGADGARLAEDGPWNPLRTDTRTGPTLRRAAGGGRWRSGEARQSF